MPQQTINIGSAPDDGTGDTLRVGGDKINDNFTELYTDKADKAGGTFTGDIIVPDEAYDATAWNGSLEVPTKNAVRDKIESLGSGITELDDVPDVNAPSPSNGDVLTWDSTPGEWVPQAPPGAGSFVLGDATDVDTTAAASGNVLTYDGAQWEPAAPTGGSTTVGSIVMGTTAGTPGTGAFTPNAASGNYRAWSTIAAGWVGIVRFVDGSAWEVAYSYWNGTTLSRASTQLIASSTGSAISLTSAATAELMQSGLMPLESAPDTLPWRGVMAVPNSNAMAAVATSAPTAIGSLAAAAIASTNYLTEQPRCQFTSATTANAQAALHNSQLIAVHSTTAERGGYLFHFQFGASQIPTGPRVFMGLTGTTFAANTGEPSALVASYAVLGKDSGDTNLQFLCNSGSGAGTKIDTGIALSANGWYEVVIYSPKGGATVNMVLCRRDTGAVFYGSTSSDTPATGTGLMYNLIAGLSSTTGTAMVLHLGNLLCRAGF